MKRFIASAAALLMLLTGLIALEPKAEAAGSAPVAANLELTTYRGVSVGGQLAAYDPDGGELTFEITTPPVKGTIELSDGGSFIYTPAGGKKGRDYFGYKAIDSEGNRSQEATAIIRIEKQKKSIEYADMSGRAEEYAALRLAETGVFTGEKLGERYCFYPERELSRGEFLSMCMLAAGEDAFPSVLSTGFGDDASIPAWMKGYVTTAVMCGVIDTAAENENFSAQETISGGDAALILNAAMAYQDVSYIKLNAEMDEELAQACANLIAYGVGRLQDHAPQRLILPVRRLRCRRTQAPVGLPPGGCLSGPAAQCLQLSQRQVELLGHLHQIRVLLRHLLLHRSRRCHRQGKHAHGPSLPFSYTAAALYTRHGPSPASFSRRCPHRRGRTCSTAPRVCPASPDTPPTCSQTLSPS